MKILSSLGALFNKIFIGAPLILLSIPAMANPAGGAAVVNASGQSMASDLIALTMGLLYIVSAILAVIFIVQGFLKLITNAKNPNDPKGNIQSIFLTFLAAAILSSVYTSASTFVKTISGSDGFCFLEQQNMTGEVRLPSASQSACFNAETSEITKGMKDRLTQTGDSNWNKFKERVNIFFALVQVIGLYFFIKSLVLLKGVADGRDQTTYGKVFIMMIFSAIAMDLSKAIEIIVETFSNLISNE